MVFGVNALVTKPAISFAPMFTVALLNSYGYTSATSSVPGVQATTAAMTAVQQQALEDVMFYMTCAVPVITGLLQLFVWQFYTIRDSHKTSLVLHVAA